MRNLAVLGLLMLCGCTPSKCIKYEKQLVTEYPYMAFAGSDNPALRTMAFMPMTYEQEVCVEYERLPK